VELADVAPSELTTSDGYRLKYRAWSPEGPPVASVVLLTGIMSNSRWMAPLVPGLLEAGVHVVGADRRGAGPNRQGRGDAPSATVVVSDALEVIEAEVPADRPLLLVGWCWGTVLGLNVAMKLKERLSGFVMVAPGLFPSAAIERAAKEHEAAAEGAAQDEAKIASPVAEEMFTRGPHLDGFVRVDPERLLAFTPRYRAIMGKLAMGAMLGLRKLKSPLLVLLAQGDPATDNDAVRAAIAKVPSSRTAVEETPSDHGMQFDVPEWVGGHLAAFMRSVVPVD